MGRVRFFASLAALATLSAIAPLASMPARADACTSNIIIFGFNSNAEAAYDPSGVYCIADPDMTVDAQILTPASDEIEIRYTDDVPGKPESILATVNGLGLVNRSVPLTRVEDDTTGLVTYDSSTITLPDGQSASGCVRASIGGDIDDSNSYHTFDSSC
jgi:hypothetical protein